MNKVSKKKHEDTQKLYRKLMKVNKEMRRRGISEGDIMLGRINDGDWVKVIYSGVNPDSEKPFFTELPDNRLSYFDRLAAGNSDDDIGTQNEIEGELTGLDIWSWCDGIITEVCFSGLPSEVGVDGVHSKVGFSEIHTLTESFYNQYSSSNEVVKDKVVDLEYSDKFLESAQFKVKAIDNNRVFLEYIGTVG